MEINAMVVKGEQGREKAEIAKQQTENAVRLGEARAGAASAKGSTSTSHADATDALHSGAHKSGEKLSLTSAVEGMRIEGDKGKGKAKTTSGFSLGSGGAHLKVKKELTPEEQAAKKAKRQEILDQKQMAARESRVNDRLSRRVPGLPAPGKIDVHHDKMEGYALNSAHPEGGPKSAAYAAAGFRRINTYEKGNPNSWRKPAAADQKYQDGRNALISKLKSDVQTNHATKQNTLGRETYYTKHTILSPHADASHKPVVVKAAWQYNREEGSHDVGRLTTLIPSGYSTDEDAEKVAKSKANKK